MADKRENDFFTIAVGRREVSRGNEVKGGNDSRKEARWEGRKEALALGGM